MTGRISTHAGDFPVRAPRPAGGVPLDDPMANRTAAVLFALGAMTADELTDLVVDLGRAGDTPELLPYRAVLRSLADLAALVADAKEA